MYGTDSISFISGLANGVHVGTYTDNLSNATGNGLSNYNIHYVNGSLSITPASLIATVTATAKTYDGTTNLPSTTTLVGVLGTDSITGSTVLTLAGNAAGTQSIVVNPTILAGSNPNDYVVVNQLLAGSANGGGNGPSNSPGSNGSNNGTGGNGSGGGNSGYNTIISKANLTITGNNSSTTVYNAGTQTNGYTSSGLFGADSITSVTGLANGVHVGTYTDNLTSATGTGLSNYNIQFVNGSLTITPAQLIANVIVNPKSYDGTNNLSSITNLSGVLGGDSITGSTGLNTNGSGAGSQSIIANQTILSGANASDYTVVNQLISGSSTNGNGNGTPTSPGANGGNNGTNGNGSNSGNSGYNTVISKANLTITGANGTVTYNGTTQNNGTSFAVSGLVSGDSVSAVSGQASGLHAGVYNDNLSGATGTGLSNYNIIYANGKLTISPASLIATVNVLPKTYDGTTNLPSSTTLAGVLGSDSITGSTTLTLAGSSAGSQNVIVSPTALSGSNTADYVVVNQLLSGSATGGGNGSPTSPGASGGNNGTGGNGSNGGNSRYSTFVIKVSQTLEVPTLPSGLDWLGRFDPWEPLELNPQILTLNSEHVR